MESVKDVLQGESDEPTSMKDMARNWAVRTLVYPMFKDPSQVELVDMRLWNGGVVVDNTGRRYLLFRGTNCFVDNSTAKDVVEALSVLEFELDIPDECLVFHDRDAMMLSVADTIKVYDKNGQEVDKQHYTLFFPNGRGGEPNAYIIGLYSGIKKLVATFKFRYETKPRKVGLREVMETSIWVREKGKR